MKRWLWFGALIALVGLVSINCAPPASPAPAPEPKKPSGGISTRADWEVKWQNTVNLARQEGRVTIITTSWAPKAVNLLPAAFKDKYGMDLEITVTGRGAAMVAKINAEQRAGLYTYDFFGTGSTTALNIMKPEGLLGPIEPFLILPEVRDPNLWRAGRLPFVDKDKLFFGMAAAKQHYLVYNSDLIKKGEITSYKDILKPQYAGKIIINDPTTSGSGAAAFTHLALDIWNMEEAKDFLRQLVSKQKGVIERDNRLHVETVARGKYAIAMGTSPEVVASFIEAGAPVVAVVAKEGTNVTSAAAGATMPTKMAHPNAAIVFLNWLLSKEGQSVLARGWGTPSMRIDASVEGLDPLFLFIPGEKIFPPSEEKSLAMGEWMGIAKKIIEEASK